MLVLAVLLLTFACLIVGALLLAVETVRTWNREDPELLSSRPPQSLDHEARS